MGVFEPDKSIDGDIPNGYEVEGFFEERHGLIIARKTKRQNLKISN